MAEVQVIKGKADGMFLDKVIPYDNYVTGENQGSVGVLVDGVILPLRKKGDNKPGMYEYAWGHSPIMPTEEEMPNYAAEGNNIINFSDVKNVREYIDKHHKLRDMEREILTNTENVTIPPFLENDTPEMRLFKEAIIEKQADIENYKQRFGNYGNDKRKISESSITFPMLKRFANVLDMEMELIIRDKNPDVPNPIGKELRTIITGGDISE